MCMHHGEVQIVYREGRDILKQKGEEMEEAVLITTKSETPI